VPACHLIAEHFRDGAHENVLLLIDNVYRLVHAGGKVSGVLGRLPSCVGYRPTFASEIAARRTTVGWTIAGGQDLPRRPGRALDEPFG
jgi:F0F1-type ATP synthase beta subunit